MLCRSSFSLLRRAKPAILQRAASTTPSTVWQNAVRLIPARTILPMALDGSLSKTQQQFAAWKGDKILAAASAQAVETIYHNKNASPSVGQATIWTGRALSNSFLAARAQHLLPANVFEQAKSHGLSDREIGTMVEAAIAQVDKNQAAILDLATWLLHQAADNPGNSKSLLLEHGGTVTSKKTTTVHNNRPKFQATAKLGTERQRWTAESKRKAEQTASGLLLERLGFQSDATSLPLDNASIPKDETAQQWWQRGALDSRKAHRRANLAPFVFPESIAAVETRVKVENNKQVSSFMIVSSKTSYHVTPVCQASSRAQACSAVGIQANQIIAQIVGVDLPME